MPDEMTGETLRATMSLSDIALKPEALEDRAPVLVLVFEAGQRLTENLRGFLNRFDCVVVRSEGAPPDLLATFTFDAILVNLGPVADRNRQPQCLTRLLDTLSARYAATRLIIRAADALTVDERLLVERHGAIVHSRGDSHSKLVQSVRMRPGMGATERQDPTVKSPPRT